MFKQKKIIASLLALSLCISQSTPIIAGTQQLSDNDSYIEESIFNRIIKNAFENQENYNEEYDRNKDGKVTVGDAGLQWSYTTWSGGKIDYTGQDWYSEKLVLDVKQDNNTVTVDVSFYNPFRSGSGKNGGFDAAILYDNQQLKLEKFQWSDEFIKTYPSADYSQDVLSNGSSDSALEYKDMGEYVAIAGLYYSGKNTDVFIKNIATLTFSTTENSENATDSINITTDGSKYKNNLSELKANQTQYIIGSSHSDGTEPLNLSDALSILEYALGIYNYRDDDYYDYTRYLDLDDDNDITLKDTLIALNQALGITEPIVLKWDGSTFYK